MYVTCSTLCYGRTTLDNALKSIAELQFGKYDLSISEKSKHIRPSEITGDLNGTVNRLRNGQGLTPAAFNLDLNHTPADESANSFKSVLKLARITNVSQVTISASPSDCELSTEIERLDQLNRLAVMDAVQLNIATETGTLTEDPDKAFYLCEKVPGLGLTLDPTTYTIGPFAGKNHDHLFPYVRHVQLRDTGIKPDQYQVRIGQGQIDYWRIIGLLEKY